MSNNKHRYNIPMIITMIKQKYTYKQIANSEAVKPPGCSIAGISEIKKLWRQGEIWFQGIGTLQELKRLKILNKPPEPPEPTYKPTYKPSYLTICIGLLLNYMSVKTENLGYYSLKDLKQAYLHFSKVLHPDTNKSDPITTKKFIALQEAKEYIRTEHFGGILR